MVPHQISFQTPNTRHSLFQTAMQCHSYINYRLTAQRKKAVSPIHNRNRRKHSSTKQDRIHLAWRQPQQTRRGEGHKPTSGKNQSRIQVPGHGHTVDACWSRKHTSAGSQSRAGPACSGRPWPPVPGRCPHTRNGCRGAYVHLSS